MIDSIIGSLLWFLAFPLSMVVTFLTMMCLSAVRDFLVKPGQRELDQKLEILIIAAGVATGVGLCGLLWGYPLTTLLMLPLIGLAIFVLPVVLLALLFGVMDVAYRTEIFCAHTWAEEKSHVLVCTKCHKVLYGYTLEPEYRSSCSQGRMF